MTPEMQVRRRGQRHAQWLFISIAIGLAFAASAPYACADNHVAGPLIVFNDNGAWCWFQDERAIIDAENGNLLMSSVASRGGAVGESRAGDVDVISYDLASQTLQRHVLSHALQADDHNSAALLILPDGRYLASYSKHGSDNRLRYRVSTRAGDISSWDPEQTFRTAGGTTYSNLYYLSDLDTIFNFHRDYGRGLDPNYLIWDFGHARDFSYGGRFLTGPEGNIGSSDRPYLRYAGNGINRIDFIATDAHPRNLLANSVYHGYLQYEAAGRIGVYQSDGNRLGDLSTEQTSPYKASDFTVLLEGNAVSAANGLRMTRAWTTDIELDREGHPYVLFTARVDDNDADHRLFYGRYNGSGWKIYELAKAGGYLYEGENDYTGLAALVPDDPQRVFVSTNVDPRTDAAMPRYEIFMGTTSDGGASWSWWPITFNSTLDNLRPVVPKGAADGTVLLWMRGTYRSYTDYDVSIVGLVDITPQ